MAVVEETRMITVWRTRNQKDTADISLAEATLPMLVLERGQL